MMDYCWNGQFIKMVKIRDTNILEEKIADSGIHTDGNGHRGEIETIALSIDRNSSFKFHFGQVLKYV